MRKILRKIFINSFKNIFFMLLNSDSKYFSIDTIDLKLKKDCKLGKKNSIISSQLDQMITPSILKHGEWEYFIINFIKKEIKNKKEKLNFVDIGANIGLISKQLLNEKLGINKFLCIEPEKKNFSLLKKNLELFNNVLFYNFALTEKKSGYQKIYINKNNIGDYTLLKKINLSAYFIKCININIFFKKLFNKSNNKIIYKSDTQGLDEILILSLDKKYLKKIKILIIEISNFDFLKKNKKNFLNLTKYFSNIEDERGNKINQKDISIKINKQNEFNLLLSKN